MTERSTTDRPAMPECPWWCDQNRHELGHGALNRDHMSDGVHVSAIRAVGRDYPDVGVYLTQREDGDRAAYAPLLSLAGGAQAELTSEQASQLVVAIADQLARLEPMLENDQGFNCPSWCVIDRAQHREELDSWEGGAIHWSRHLQGVGTTHAIRVAAVTRASGSRELLQSVAIHLGDDEPLTATEARKIAHGLLAAAAWADIAEGQLS